MSNTTSPYQGYYNGKCFRSAIKYQPINHAATFVDRIWLTAGFGENREAVVELHLLMKDESRMLFVLKDSFEKLFNEADEWIENQINKAEKQ